MSTSPLSSTFSPISNRFQPLRWLLITMVLVTTGCIAESSQPQADHNLMRYIDISGEGTVKAIPDQFDLYATAWSEGQEVSTLKKQVDQQVQAILKAARQLDVDENRIQAMHVQMSPRYEYIDKKRKLVGYHVSRRIQLQAQGIEQYAALMEALTEAGINQLQPGGRSFSERKALEHEALRLAMEDARTKAEILAKSANAELGKTITIQETGSHIPQPVMLRENMAVMAASDAGPSASYAAGETELKKRVSVRFQLR